MRFLIVIGFISLVLLVYIKNAQPTNLEMPQSSPTTTPIPATQKGIMIILGPNHYLIYLQKITDPKDLTLIPNFTEKKSSVQLVEEYNCRYGVNGGFYTPDGKPLGLFYSKAPRIESRIHDQTFFNGFVSQSSSGRIDISKEPPQFGNNNFAFYFQSGPLFTPETRLTIRNDERARRILIGKTNEGDFYFIALTETDNINSGPHLADLPQLIHQINNETVKQFVLLLNLDGGSASAYLAQNGPKLEELTPVGSFLCGR